jgi:hypothetical protein
MNSTNWIKTEVAIKNAPAAFNRDCSLSFFRIGLNSARPPPRPGINQAVLGTRTKEAASHIAAERSASATYNEVNQVMLFLHPFARRVLSFPSSLMMVPGVL